MDQLTNQRGDPLSPLDLKQRILDQVLRLIDMSHEHSHYIYKQWEFFTVQNTLIPQCETARNVLMKRWIPEVAMAFITLRDHWKGLVPRNKRESLSQVKRFFRCVRAVMSIHLRYTVISGVFYRRFFGISVKWIAEVASYLTELA